MDRDAFGTGGPGHGAGQALEHDHHRIDGQFTAFTRALADDVLDTDAFTRAAEALRHHIYVEEELHFPVLREAGLLAPVLVMLREHGVVWDLLDDIVAALAEGDIAAVRTVWPQLVQALERHNAKEERILYPAGDQTLPVEVGAAVVTALATGTTPPGWVCEMGSRSHL
jgi:regulator of cell morphogenesis and NO signaling